MAGLQGALSRFSDSMVAQPAGDCCRSATRKLYISRPKDHGKSARYNTCFTLGLGPVATRDEVVEKHCSRCEQEAVTKNRTTNPPSAGALVRCAGGCQSDLSRESGNNATLRPWAAKAFLARASRSMFPIAQADTDSPTGHIKQGSRPTFASDNMP